MLRTKRIKHAILVVGHLQSALDFAKGAKVARDLDSSYNAVRQSLVWVQFHPSKRGVTQLITDLLAVRGAWIVVDHAERPSATLAAGMVPSAGAGSASDHERVDWKG